MKSTRSIKNIIAVAFAFALILSSSAQASNLLGLDRDLAPRAASERSVGLFDQVSAWLMGAWSNLTSAFADETTTTPPVTAAGCDAGWGLDPEGCPKG
ncbi:MAG TPA: hypothetical protein VH394_13715 [Thermoanaerobaculia bacterium]|jgi:hypothetical protein|nr:hypothetical protein [Thermoanaerobaculia bacterium]